MLKFKKYKNKKIYCSNWESGDAKKTACYVQVSDVLKSLRQGHKIEVLSNETGKDLTELVMSMALVKMIRNGRIPGRNKLYELFK